MSYFTKISDLVMSVVDKFYAFIMNLFLPKKKVKTEKEIEMELFIEKIGKRGYKYDEKHDWYMREWTTNEGRESVYEGYKREVDRWNQIMRDEGGEIFYEEQTNVRQ